MELKKNIHGWELAFKDGFVQLIQIDFRLGLFVSEPPEVVQLYIETPCKLIGPCVDTTLIPGLASSLGPALSLFNLKVMKVTIGTSGNLSVQFEGSYSLKIAASNDYEAWQLASSTMGFLLVCSPGGDVSYFTKDTPNNN